MIVFNSDGFWSAGMILLFWGLTDSRMELVVAGGVLILTSFWGSFFQMFSRKPELKVGDEFSGTR